MEAGANILGRVTAKESGTAKQAGRQAAANMSARAAMQLPEKVFASAGPGFSKYDARRLRSQREIIRDVMLAAADCDTWLTLGELRALTRYGEASISAQLRHLRKCENGGYEVAKRHREGAIAARSGADGRSEYVWEYRMDHGTRAEAGASSVEGRDSRGRG
jgi:hypothetical protein